MPSYWTYIRNVLRVQSEIWRLWIALRFYWATLTKHLSAPIKNMLRNESFFYVLKSFHPCSTFRWRGCMEYLFKCFPRGWRQFRFESTPQGIIYRRLGHRGYIITTWRTSVFARPNRTEASPTCSGPLGEAKWPMSHFLGGFQKWTLWDPCNSFVCLLVQMPCDVTKIMHTALREEK